MIIASINQVAQASTNSLLKIERIHLSYYLRL